MLRAETTCFVLGDFLYRCASSREERKHRAILAHLFCPLVCVCVCLFFCWLKFFKINHVTFLLNTKTQEPIKNSLVFYCWSIIDAKQSKSCFCHWYFLLELSYQETINGKKMKCTAQHRITMNKGKSIARIDCDRKTPAFIGLLLVDVTCAELVEMLVVNAKGGTVIDVLTKDWM